MTETHSVFEPRQPMLCPLPQTALTSLSPNSSSALPGDTLNSTVVEATFSANATAKTNGGSVSYLQLLYTVHIWKMFQ